MPKHPQNRYERLYIKKVKEFGKIKARRPRLEQTEEGLENESISVEVLEGYDQAESRSKSVEREDHV